MAVVACHEIWSGRSINLRERWQRTYQRIFRVQVDTTTDGQIEIIQGANGIPLLYSGYTNASGTEVDRLALCNDISGVQDDADDPFLWKVTCSYSTRTFDPSQLKKTPGQDTSNTDPLSRLPDLQWSFLPFLRPLVRDFGSKIWQGDGTGLPLIDTGSGSLLPNDPVAAAPAIKPRFVCDSAGVPFDPPLEYDDSRLVLNYRRNEPAYNPLVARAYKDAVNTDDFLVGSENVIIFDEVGGVSTGTIGRFPGFPKGMVKCANIGAVRKFESSVIYFEVNYEFHISFEGWFANVADAGYYQLDGTGNRTPITDAKSNQVVAPWPLNGNGTALTKAQIDAGSLAFDFFFPYRELRFAPLGIE